jgi:hypothetical protein
MYATRIIDPRIRYADTRKHMTTQKALRTQIKKKFQTTRQPLLKFPTEITQPTLVAQAYADAKQLEPSFRSDIQRVASELGVQGQCRPNTGIKSAERILEKMINGVVPVDMLGAKLIVTTLEQAYELASRVPQFFTVKSFKDRFLQPRSSGYADLQFIVAITQTHYAELKIVLTAFDELDAIEHRIFEIVRSLQAKAVQATKLTNSEEKVMLGLQEMAMTLYLEVWQEVLAKEVR